MLNMAELLWEGVLIATVLLFGINIGLAMGLKQIPRNKLLSISLLYGAVLFTLSVLANYANQLMVINNYVPPIIGVLGFVTILTGIYTIIQWRKNNEGNKKNEEYSFLSKITIIPSICCIVGFTSIDILLNKSPASLYSELNMVMSVMLVLIIIFIYSFSKFLRHAERPYPILLGNFMILNGMFLVIVALFIPNIESLSSVQTSPLSISSTNNLIFLLMAAGGVFLMGVYLTKENITSLKDITQRKPFKKK